MTRFKAPVRPFIKARHYGGRQTPKAVVIHATVSPDNPGTARAIAAMWHGPNSPDTSAHYVVDPREDIQCVGDHSVAYHCGYNTDSIAIELCDEQVGPATRWRDKDSQAIIRRAATLTAELCLAYGIEVRRPHIAELKAKGPHGIYGHNDSRLAFGHTTHTDPREFPWAEFMALVRSEVARLRHEASAPAPAHAPKVPKTRGPAIDGALKSIRQTQAGPLKSAAKHAGNGFRGKHVAMARRALRAAGKALRSIRKHAKRN